MESAAKRKAATAASPENEGRPSKRQKVPESPASPTTGETVESTTAAGLKFLESLRSAKDKTGRPIATHFLELPDKNEIPEYYEVIKLPFSIESMEEKLNAGGYSTLAELESDCKRLVNNAKVYNDKKSPLYEDAERLRKTASNWMVRNNPAYKKPGYTAMATPVPGEDPLPPGRPLPRVSLTPSKIHTPTPDTTERPRRAAAATQPTTPAPSKLKKSAPPVAQDEGTDFTGKTFQQAQEQLITDMIEYTDQDLQIFQPFVNLPSRALKDYYQAIKHPMCLSLVRKRVQGVVGRGPPTGTTSYKTWSALESDVALVWENAKEYNEDGSDIYNLALEFEGIFKMRLAKAKAKVEEPPQPTKLKLNMSTAPNPTPKQTMKLKLGSRQSPISDPNTPAARSSATPGVAVDSEALSRQSRHVQESVAGSRSSRPSSAGKNTPSATPNPISSTRGASASIPAPSNPVAKTVAASSPAPNGIKTDVQSPALNAIRPASTASDNQSQRLSVPAPNPQVAGATPSQNASRPASGSPHPNGVANQPGQPGAVQPPQPQVPVAPYVPPPVAPNYDNFRRTPLKSLDEALIPKITLSTPPSLPVAQPFRKTLTAHPKKITISYTLNLAPGNSYLHIVPSLPVALTGRPYRAFVSINGNRIMESSRLPQNLNGMPPNFDASAGKKKGEPLYEAKLMLGLNRIEIEVIAERERSRGKEKEKDGPASVVASKETQAIKDGGEESDAAANGADATPAGLKKEKELVDVEKCVIFANLRR
ncbi:Bromodomain-containing protein [Aaosphaeria arxii CBS 175.79]|uniref:Bromodomain-containing protein n=1 Tax=Aaosphaeria arxii CBS 175.79 TaxID=1450172 RepID=A0A6A5XJJ9_9PLEO|nr:Bromodomain-containing protein [Aaosphaeria arxii CBS 175.79]KAF2013455.1 Bromodomain-containing protein [Aaosphaeria arxii CBS 175.79]